MNEAFETVTNRSRMIMPSQMMGWLLLNHSTVTIHWDNFHQKVRIPLHFNAVQRCRTIVCARGWLTVVMVSLVMCLMVEGAESAAVVDGVNRQKPDSGNVIIQVNVTQELITRVAEQRLQHLLTEEERLQQRGSGGEKTSSKSNPKQTTNGDAKKHGNKKPELRQSDSPKLAANGKEPCQPLPPVILRQILGAAYNPRYMSINKPSWADGTDPNSAERAASIKNGQRDQEWPQEPQQKLESFHVHGGYTRILHEEPVVVHQVDDSDDARGRQWNMNGLDDVGGEDMEDEKKEADIADVIDVQTTPPPHHRRHSHHTRKGGNKQRHQTPGNRTKNRNANRDESQSHTKNAGKHHHTAQPPQKHKAKTVDTEAYFKALTFEQVDQQPASDDEVPPVTSGSDKFLSLIRNRRTVKAGFPWSCESRIEWIDLGPNHFPRFLRSVVCTSDRCWFLHFQCRPKAFTVKILRRRKDSCEPSNVDEDDYSSDLASDEKGVIMEETLLDINARVPNEFREQWVFEERAVTFCCECAM